MTLWARVRVCLKLLRLVWLPHAGQHIACEFLLFFGTVSAANALGFHQVSCWLRACGFQLHVRSPHHSCCMTVHVLAVTCMRCLQTDRRARSSGMQEMVWVSCECLSALVWGLAAVLVAWPVEGQA